MQYEVGLIWQKKQQQCIYMGAPLSSDCCNSVVRSVKGDGMEGFGFKK